MPERERRLAERLARGLFGLGAGRDEERRAIAGWLGGAVAAAIGVPLLFYLRFGEVGGLGWGVTIFLAALCGLMAVGIYFLRRPEYHTPVAPRGGWADRVGALWLVACAFGPLAGWLLTELPPLTLGNWRWLYGGRVLCAIGLPVLTALPLLRYVRGRGAPVMLALLIGVSALPIWSAWSVAQDLWAGPVGGLLAHTGQVLQP